MNAAVRGLVLVSVWMLVTSGSVAQAGMLFGFDVAVGGDHQFNGGQISGRSLIAGNTTGNGGSVGGGLGWNPDGDTYVVRGSRGAGLNVQSGSVRIGGKIGSSYLNMNGKGTVKSLAGFDALDLTDPKTLQASLQAASNHFAGLTSSSSYSVAHNTLTFTATPGSDGVAVFDVNAAALNNRNLNYALDIGSASSVVFNVTGDIPLSALGNFHGSFRDSASEILWNFKSAQDTLNFIDREWFGSILMPNASLTNQSAINGGVYVGGNFNQSGDVRQVGYSGPSVSYPPPPTDSGDLPIFEDRPKEGDAPDIATVPEPSTIMVFAMGGLIFAGQQWRKRRQPSVAGA